MHKGQCCLDVPEGQPLGKTDFKRSLKGYLGASQTKKVWRWRKFQAEEVEIYKGNQKQMTNT